MDGDCELVIGNKNLSSWSLRPWLVLKAFDIPFKETPILLRQPDSRANILASFALRQGAGAEQRRSYRLGQPCHHRIPG